MLFYVQAGLAAAGLGILVLGRLPLGEREVRSPLSSLIGLTLAAALPLTVLLLLVLSAGETSRLARTAGLDRAYVTAAAAYWWVRPLILLLTVVVAGGLTAIGVRPVRDEPAAPVVPSDLLEKSAAVLGGRADGIVAAPAAWAPADDLSPVVGRYRAPGEGVPPEVEALGTAGELFRPTAAGGLTSWWEGRTPTSALVFRQALVTVTGDDFVIVPWNAVESITGRTLRSSDGQTVEVPAGVEGASRLERIVRARVGERLLADVQARLDAGEEVSFGPLAATASGLRYKGKRMEWFEVAHVRIFEGRSLHVTTADGPLPWCMVPREQIANEFLLLELIGKYAPGAVQAAAW